MKNKKIIISLIFVIFIFFVIILNYFNEDKEILTNSNINLDYSKIFSLMLESESVAGEYIESPSSSWPNGYKFNETLSGCENGGILEYDALLNQVVFKGNKTDKCYVFFDLPEPDVQVSIKNKPTTYTPSATLSCTGGSASYDRKGNVILVNSITDNINCNLTYNVPATKEYLNQKLIASGNYIEASDVEADTSKTITKALVKEYQSNGTSLAGYYFEGKDPDNYVWFNNELWRIIGVFDETTHGKSGQNLVKIIRESSLGGLAWHKSNTNEWASASSNTTPVASLNSLLNGPYLDWKNNKASVSTYCYGYSTTVAGNCDYSDIGIKDDAREMIVSDATWHLGGMNTSSSSANNYYAKAVSTYYTYERGLAEGYITYNNSRQTTYKGSVGLMYMSDYGYGVLANTCVRTTALNSYSNANCAGKNWLYGQGYEWTMTPSPYSSYYVLNVTSRGYANLFDANYGYAVRPVLYLKSDTYVVNWNEEKSGTRIKPYIIGI